MARILVVGAGAVGGYYAALMARHFPEGVLLLARHDSYEAVRRSGLVLQGSSGEDRITVQVTDDPSSVSNQDYVMDTVKMYDLEPSLVNIEGVVRSAKGVFGLQNGIEKESVIERHCPGKSLMATTYVSSEKVAPGVISYTPHKPRVYIGEEGNKRTERLAEIQKMLNDSGIECRVPDDIRYEVWSKFVYACSILGVCAAARCDLGAATAYEPTRRLLVESLEEGIAVARAHGVQLSEERKRRYLDSFTRTDNADRPSMLVDVLRGRRTEVEFINGALIRKATEKDMRVPVNEFLYAVLSGPKLST